MFSIFKKLFQRDLYALAKNQHRKEWKRRLKIIEKNVKQCAKNGLFEHVVPDHVLRCEYNKDRTWVDITEDIKKRFPGCMCVMFAPPLVTGQGNTFCKISWQKSS